jgi:hypothetical protein
MRVHVLRREQRLPAPPEAVFPFFADARNLEAITPPLLRFRLLTPDPIEMGVGTFLQYALQLRGVPVRWDTLIQEWDPPHRFVDVQVRGIGLGALGEIARRAVVTRDLDAIFAFREKRVPELVAASGDGAPLG